MSPSRFPHMRGDGPDAAAAAAMLTEFSPHAWGWSDKEEIHMSKTEVFPTCVGMVRRSSWASWASRRFPHMRGDGPAKPYRDLAREKFSPHSWGWSEAIAGDVLGRFVFPTCVGMVRVRVMRRAMCKSFPHMRGDGPESLSVARTRAMFSPHAWGWSVL